jgi:7-cyano-7-deazaguanine synthase
MAVANALGISHKIVDLSALRDVMGGSSQTDDVPVPHGHYTDETMKQTVVPNRNMVLLAVAGAYAISLKAEHVAYAAHAGDHAIYPDCRPEFAEAVGVALALADWHHVTLRRPFVLTNKSGIVLLGANIGAPLGLTYSCYEGGRVHCGKCGTCVERREAFTLAGVPDPTMYEVP